MMTDETGMAIACVEAQLRHVGEIANGLIEAGVASDDDRATQLLWDVVEFAFNFSQKWGGMMATLAEEKGKYSAAETFYSDEAKYMRSLAERYDPEGVKYE